MEEEMIVIGDGPRYLEQIEKGQSIKASKISTNI